MNIIKTNKLTNIALFMVRIKKGGNIGTKRFDLIKQSIEMAMKGKPFNKYTNSYQQTEVNQVAQMAPMNDIIRLPRARGARGGRRPRAQHQQDRPPPS